jgi:hypothetical protein
MTIVYKASTLSCSDWNRALSAFKRSPVDTDIVVCYSEKKKDETHKANIIHKLALARKLRINYFRFPSTSFSI